MMPDRRTLLASVAGLALAGCTGSGEGDGQETGGTADPTSEEADDSAHPADCPTTQGLDVRWPSTLDTHTVASFLEIYEHRYYRDVVVEYEPESRLDEYALSVSIEDGPRRVDGGFEATLSGGGGVYRPTLHLTATVAEPPAEPEPVPMSEIETPAIRDFLAEAVGAGEAEHHVEPPGDLVEEHLQRFETAAEDFSLTGRGDEDAFHVDMNGTTVELVAEADSFHGDYWWTARYYLDEDVLWRSADAESTPRAGQLLECQSPE